MTLGSQRGVDRILKLIPIFHVRFYARQKKKKLILISSNSNQVLQLSLGPLFRDGHLMAHLGQFVVCELKFLAGQPA